MCHHRDRVTVPEAVNGTGDSGGGWAGGTQEISMFYVMSL